MSDVADLIAEMMKYGVRIDIIGRTAALAVHGNMIFDSRVLRVFVDAKMTNSDIIAAVEAIEAAMPLRIVVDEAAVRRRDWDRDRKRELAKVPWADLRLQVFERDGYICSYCQIDVSNDPQCDHVVPLSRGGPSTLENLTTACRPCNTRKRDRTPEEWRASLC